MEPSSHPLLDPFNLCLNTCRDRELITSKAVRSVFVQCGSWENSFLVAFWSWILHSNAFLWVILLNIWKRLSLPPHLLCMLTHGLSPSLPHPLRPLSLPLLLLFLALSLSVFPLGACLLLARFLVPLTQWYQTHLHQGPHQPQGYL